MASVWTYTVTVGHVCAPRHTGVQSPGAAQSPVPAAPHAEPGSLEGHLACGRVEDRWVIDSKGAFLETCALVPLPFIAVGSVPCSIWLTSIIYPVPTTTFHPLGPSKYFCPTALWASRLSAATLW